MLTAIEALKSDDDLIVVTYDLTRRRDIAEEYVSTYLAGSKGRWFNSYWFRLLDRIILEDKVSDLDPEQKLYYDRQDDGDTKQRSISRSES